MQGNTDDALAGRLQVLVIDGQPIVRDALGRLICSVAADAAWLEAEDVAAGEALLAAYPGVSLTIVDLGEQAGAAPMLLRRLREAGGDRPVLVMAPADDPALACAMLEEGARGFVSKRAPTALLREVVRLLLAGGLYVPPAAVGVAEAARPAPAPSPVATVAGARRPAPPPVRLTERQQAVLALMLRGRPNKLICRTLNLREGTVKTHIANIFRTLNVNNRTEAAYAVRRLGIDLPDIEERTPPACPLRRPRLSIAA